MPGVLANLADDVPGLEGWDLYGTVDRLEGESIGTWFFCFIVPLWFGSSTYVWTCRDGGTHHTTIALQPRSVILGYSRTSAWFGAIVFGVAGLASYELRGGLLITGLVLAAIAAALTFGAGRLGHAERKRRMLLRRIVGLGAPPELLPADMVSEIREDLVEDWNAESETPWYNAIMAGEGSELLIAIAEYHQKASLIERARTNLAS